MIDRIVFPADATADLFDRYEKGSSLVVFPRATKDGTGIAFDVDFLNADQLAGTEDCDEPVNSSHVCPGSPLCP